MDIVPIYGICVKVWKRKHFLPPFQENTFASKHCQVFIKDIAIHKTLTMMVHHTVSF